MTSENSRRVSPQEIQLVQNLIERCLLLYMNQKEAMETLLVQAKIEPDFTELVWQKLEDENQEFFKAYHICLMLKHQIMIFNKLLTQQVDLMHRIPTVVASLPINNESHCPTGVPSLPISNGYQCPTGVALQPISNGPFTLPLHQTLSCYVSEHIVTPSSHHPICSSSALINGVPSMHRSMETTDDTSAFIERMHISPDTLSSQNSNTGMLQGINEKPNFGYSNSATFTFGPDGYAFQTHPTIKDASFSTVPLNGPLLDGETTSFGFFDQIPQNFSLSNLTSDFSQNSNLLEKYSRSPFLPTDVDNFINSPGRECQERN